MKLWDSSKQATRTLMDHQAWQLLMIAAVLVGTVGIGMENPLDAPDSTSANQLRDLDLTISIIFVFELSLGVHAYGFVRRRKSYLRRDGWNVVDAVLVISNLIAVIITRAQIYDSNSRSIYALTAVRALRPLRV